MNDALFVVLSTRSLLFDEAARLRRARQESAMNCRQDSEQQGSAAKEILILIGITAACILGPYLLSKVFGLF